MDCVLESVCINNYCFAGSPSNFASSLGAPAAVRSRRSERDWRDRNESCSARIRTRWAGAHRQRTRPIGLGVNQPAVWRAAARLRPSGRSAKTVHSRPGGTPGRRAGDRAAAGPAKGAGAAGARASRRCYARRPGCEVDPGGATTSDPGAKGGCAETGACQAKDVGTRGSWGQDGPGPGKPSSAADLAFH